MSPRTMTLSQRVQSHLVSLNPGERRSATQISTALKANINDVAIQLAELLILESISYDKHGWFVPEPPKLAQAATPAPEHRAPALTDVGAAMASRSLATVCLDEARLDAWFGSLDVDEKADAMLGFFDYRSDFGREVRG